MAETKKQKILDLYEKHPRLPNKFIAERADASIGYVRRLLGTRPGQRQRKQVDVFGVMKKERSDFVSNYLPTVEYKHEVDFANSFLPTDDQWATSGSGTDFSGSWSQYEYLAEQRVGLAGKIASQPANDAIREGFQMMDINTKMIVERKEIAQWVKDTDFLNQLARVIYFERVYGIGFLIAYYTEDDKEKGLLSKEQKPGQEPVAFEAIPPTVMSPINVFESNKLDKNPQKWDLMGGLYDPQTIHHSRIRVFMSRPKMSRWYGISIFEPMWDSILSYYQAIIYLLRGFSKWGNMIPIVTIPDTDDLAAIFDKNVEVIEEMKLNGTFIFPNGSTVAFANTQIAAGLKEMMEIWIEDISSWTGIPVPILMGRAQAAGMGSEMYLVFERYYWNMIKNIQVTFTDDVEAILKFAGFDLKEQEPYWNLAMTKTDQQRLMDEAMEIENEILREQAVQMQIQTLMMMEQAQNPQPIDKEPNDDKKEGPSATKAPQVKNLDKQLDKKANDKKKVDTDFINERDALFAKMRAERLQKIKNMRKGVA